MPDVPVPPGFIRPDPVPHPDLPTIKKSGEGRLNSGISLQYSTIADYVQHYVALGIVRDHNDLIENYGHLLPEIFFQWISTGQLGCIFAAKLARRPRENRWLPIVQLGALTEGSNLGGLLNSQLDAASQNHEAAVLIFPDVNSQEEVVQLITSLCHDPSGRWYWTDEGIDPDPTGAISLVGLRWILANDTCVNYVLGFSSLSTMPLTRQSPFTALFMRIREEKMTPSDLEDGRIQVHLADLDSTFHPQERHDQILELTREYRADRVEPHMRSVARARVTFGIDPQLASSILCPPKKVVREKDSSGTGSR